MMMTESADEGDVKRADQTGTYDTPAPGSSQVQVKTTARTRGRVKGAKNQRKCRVMRLLKIIPALMLL